VAELLGVRAGRLPQHRVTSRLLLAAALTGLAAGLGAVALTVLLHAVQHLAFGYTENTFLTGVRHASPRRRVLALAAGGAIAGPGWALHRRWLRRHPDTPGISVTGALAAARPRLPVLATAVDAVLQIVAVGAGASLGREGAPRQIGAALGGVAGGRLGLDERQRRMLLAAGAGAGLAAVYNVPLGGVAFTLELLLGTLAPDAVAAAVVSSAVATVTGWPFLGTAPIYRVGAPSFDLAVLVAALLIGPVAGVAGGAFRAAMTLARTHAPAGWPVAVTVPATFAALGALAIGYPALLGNGKALAQLALPGALPVGLAVALVLLKPVATGACLGSGAIGGLLTPAFSTGAALGLLAGDAWSQLWPGGSATAYALVGAAAMLAVTQRAPVTAVVLTLEFTHAGAATLPAIAVAVLAARHSERWARAAVLARRQVR